MKKWWKRNPRLQCIVLRLQVLWNGIQIRKKVLLTIPSLYFLIVSVAFGVGSYYERERTSISKAMTEEQQLQEGETSFLESEGYQYIKQLDEEILDVEGLDHILLRTIGDTPIAVVSTHKEDTYIEVVLQGSTIDMIQWMVGVEKIHPTIQFKIEKITHVQGVTKLQCKIYENHKK